MPLIDNLVIPQGAVWGRSYTLTAGGIPLDPTGWTAKAQIRVNFLGPALFEWRTNPSAGQGLITLTTGLAKLTLTGVTDSALWPFTHAAWDLFITSPSNQPTRVVQGAITVDPSITQ